MHNIEEIIYNIESNDSLTTDLSFKYAQICVSLIDDSDVNVNEKGRRIIINILNNWRRIPQETVDLWSNIVESAGFYPYLEKEKLSLHNLSAELRKGLHLSTNIKGKFFHDGQGDILKILNSGRNAIVSAPTSFGKSLLIEELIATKRYKSILVIQPTLALLDETRGKLSKYHNEYKLIVRTSQEPSTEKNNIFLFTAERVCEYHHFNTIDFLVIDEFYKLSGKRDDERSSALNNAFYKIINEYKPQFYLLGPNIDGITPGFAEFFGAVFYKSNYSLVDSREINVYEKHKVGLSSKGKTEYKEKLLFELLSSLDNEQTIIYCSSPARVRIISKKFCQFLVEKSTAELEYSFPIIEWIEQNVSKDWSLINSLKYGIGIHDGALQKHITSSIIDYFNNEKLKYLFCTSTIIEGVNTSAKNIVFFDATKGNKNDIDYFDYSNIKGRAGRMMEHYVGNIYNFNEPPHRNDIIIDIPFFQQDPIKDEVLIQIKDNNVLDKRTSQYKEINSISKNDKDIIKINGLNVKGQLVILAKLRNDIQSNSNLIRWTGMPNYRQLEYILKLAWDNLMVVGESKGVTLGQLIYMTFNYGNHKNIHNLIKSQLDYLKEKHPNKDIIDLKDKSIQFVFQVMRHWFQYKVPKWLSVVNELQKHVCLEFSASPGNYTFFASSIENDFLPKNLSILSEYGIPHSAIRKIEPYIPKNLSEDEVFNYIKEKRLDINKNLIKYETDKIQKITTL